MSASRLHPPAVVQRRQERDFAAFAPVFEGLSESQSRLLLLLGTSIARHVPDDFQALHDDDIADAAATLAATLETAARGLIYEHRARTRSAQHLADELKRVLEEISREAEGRHRPSDPAADGQAAAAGPVLKDAVIVLRRIEQSAREMTATLNGGLTGYRDLLARLLSASGDQASGATSRASGLIIP